VTRARRREDRHPLFVGRPGARFNRPWRCCRRRLVGAFHDGLGARARPPTQSNVPDAEQDAVYARLPTDRIGARLRSVAWAIDRQAWDEVVVGVHRQRLGEPPPYLGEHARHVAAVSEIGRRRATSAHMRHYLAHMVHEGLV